MFFLEIFVYTTSVCLGVHSLFGRGMLLNGVGSMLYKWASHPREVKKAQLLARCDDMEEEEYSAQMSIILHRKTGREIFLKPLFSCVGCMSGLYGIAICSVLCVSGRHSWTEIASGLWLDLVSAAFLCVFTNRLFWSTWESLKEAER